MKGSDPINKGRAASWYAVAKAQQYVGQDPHAVTCCAKMLATESESPWWALMNKILIWFVWEVACTLSTWRATVDEIWSAVYLGVCLM